MNSKQFRLGIDAGGTFTDFVLADGNGGIHLFKATSTPEDGTRAIADGLGQISEALDKPVSQILSSLDLCVNGTTVALNALIQHRGVKTGLICTAGHEDSLEIRLGHKEEGHRYDARYPPARMLVERRLRRPIRERVLSDGTIHTPLNEDDVRAACALFRAEGVQAVAVSFVWSVANEVHERRAAEIVRTMLPDAYVSVGLEVFPQMREYTRTSTTVVNAYLGPVLARYVNRIERFYVENGVGSPVRFYQSNGGMASSDAIVSRPVNAINSGPASAPLAGLFVARPFGYKDLITVDMGGTSFDITLTKGGITNINKDIDFLRYRIGTPMVQVETLGAGGGSIAWIDAMGLLKVGPQSASAVPGPACYMRGGTAATVTDANVVLGYLNPESLLGGRVPINGAASRAAIAKDIAEPLGISVEKAAYGIVSIVNVNMINGIRRVSIERGYDPRDFVLIAAGGATSLHIAGLAREIGVRTVLVSKLASGLCAFGQLLSDLKYNYMAACPMRIEPHSNLGRVQRQFEQLEAEAIAALGKEGFPRDRIRVERHLDMRYCGQAHECSVSIGELHVGRETIGRIRELFDARHKQLFTYAEPESQVEIVNVESTVYGMLEQPPALCLQPGSGDIERAVKARRNMIFGRGQGIEEIASPIYDGTMLGAGDVVCGPAVIEEVTTSIVLPPDWSARLDASGVYVLTDTQRAEKNER
ncbi:hydantoinase/oxoprolinase family protein [Cupriavidus basilensis]|uniref:Hydantoinase/oxoprolinase family protein n=1 Tax=Cupriavidus basilensis TaxID=68895 RepID=A0ABT6AMI9_9BURK|nr:hydantoinase/oxoprolinase family protein [Cupriavidus basilensis]MDF3833806.1 hydantoinase/oxoprolinase family protein [Cupriavidus basilensis]